MLSVKEDNFSMYEKLTDIEQIYIMKNKIDVKDLGQIEMLKIRKKAYEWAYSKRRFFDKNIENNKEEFLLFLKGCDV